jgi:hypothetical protein
VATKNRGLTRGDWICYYFICFGNKQIILLTLSPFDTADFETTGAYVVPLLQVIQRHGHAAGLDPNGSADSRALPVCRGFFSPCSLPEMVFLCR